MYKFTIFYTCRYIHLFIFFIIINCDMSHVLEINYLILSYLITNSDTHKYNTRIKDKMRSAYGKHEFMYSNFRFVGIHI